MEGLETINRTANNSNSDLYSHSMVYKMVFIFLSILIVLSNATVLLLYHINPRIRSTKNLLLASLALSDLSAGMIDIPIMMSCFEHGTRNICVPSAILFRFLAFSTILHILAIIFEKYISILHPFWVAEKKHVRFVITCIWITSSIVAVLPLAWLPDNGYSTDPGYLRAELIYFLVTFIGFFVIPFVLIVFAQVRMIRAISRSFAMVENLLTSPRTRVETILLTPSQIPAISAQRDSIKEQETSRSSPTHNRKVLTAFALMLGTFTVCWLTWYLGVLLSYVDMEKFVTFMEYLKNIPHVLVFLPSLINPLLYTYYKQDFRLALQALLTTSLKTFCH